VRNQLALAAFAALLGTAAQYPASGADLSPQEYLDPETAATVTVVAHPLVFANPRTELAANARDYVTLAAAAVNRSGKLSVVAVVYFWSTVDPRMRSEPLPAPERLIVEADDRRIELRRRAGTPHDAGVGTPVHPPPGPPVAPEVYGVDLQTLQFLAAARQLTLRLESRGTWLRYSAWDDQRAALGALVARLEGR
jgi:hypothetical protein